MATNLNRGFVHQVLCACAVGCGALNMAITLGYTSPALLSMVKDPQFQITEEEGSWLGAIVPLMALVGSLIAGSLLDSFGRRFVLLFSSFPFMLSWVGIALANTSSTVIAARFFSGLCLGVQRVSMSVFMSESVHQKIRPTMMAIPGMLSVLGSLLINVAGKFCEWRGLAWVGASLFIPPTLLLLFLPETPYFLLRKGRKKEALQNLKWLREEEKEAEKEFEDLVKGSSNGKDAINETNFAEMIKIPNRWPFCMAILFHVFQQLTGIGAIISFMGIIFKELGSFIDPNTCAIIITATNVVVVLYTAKLFSKYPRKVFVRRSSPFVVGSLVLLSFYSWARGTEGMPRYISEYFIFVPLLSIFIFACSFPIGWGPLPWLFIGDGLPSKIRGKASGVVVAANWTFSFLVTKSFSWGSRYFGYHVLFGLYATSTFLGMIVMDKYLPETFEQSATQMDKFYLDSYNKIQ